MVGWDKLHVKREVKIMTILELINILNKANEYVCRIAQGDTDLSDADIHIISNIMAAMHTFILSLEISDE